MTNYLFFDLDGTLTDPFEGITNSILYALDKMGREKPERDFLRTFIGPPLVPSFIDFLGMTAEEAERAIVLYREYYADRGIFENKVYPGIPEALETLRGAGYVLCLATSKPEPFARRILEHFGLDGFFREVCGATLDSSRVTKGDVLRELLRRIGEGDPGPFRAVMIGDRRHDAEGARTVGLGTIGVLWGYGSRDELTSAGCLSIAETPSDLATAAASL